MKAASRLIVCVLSVIGLILVPCALGGDQPDDGDPAGRVDQTPPKVVVPSVQGPGDRPKNPGTTTGTLSDLLERVQGADANRRAGLRADLLRQVQRVIPVVVIVDDAEGFLFVMSKWEGVYRFPVLWDDGSVESGEHIARFVRAFRPEKVLRIESDGAWDWSGDRAHKKQVFEAALCQSIADSGTQWDAVLGGLAGQGIMSPGIVLCDTNDAAWPAALALAAGRFQPIGFVERSGSVGPPMSPENADALERAAERLAAQHSNEWDTIGDEIDAVTLALNTGTMIKTGPGARDRISTSDRIGRREHNGSGVRWAWCGQIVGNESRSLYQAMCALFLSIDQAYIWDGYPSSPPWSAYDGTETAQILEQIGLRVELHDQPRYTIGDWQQRVVRGIGDLDGEPGSALLFLMNTKGASNAFDLPGGQSEEGKPGDMPMLTVPTALHIVHSFSLQRPMARTTVGGRLLERGVYLYAGSVDEPFLGGFLKTPLIAKRMGATMPFAAAVHFDNGKVWKIAVLGDPLVTMGRGGQRVEGGLELDGAIDLAERVRSLVAEGEYTQAIDDLVQLGRDSDASRLAMALMKDKPGLFTPSTALAAMPALYRDGRYTSMLDCYERLDQSGRSDGLMQDLLWLSSPYLLARGKSDVSLLARVEALLRANLRDGQKVADARRLAMHLRGRSLDAALGVLESLRPTLNENQRKMLDRAIRDVKR